MLIVTVESISIPGGAKSDNVVNKPTSEWQFRPTGGALLAAFNRDLSEKLSAHPEILFDQLTTAVTNVFELADRVPVLVLDTDRLIVRIEENAYGPADRFDHPIVSFLAVGLATGLDSPVSVTREPADIGHKVTFIIHDPLVGVQRSVSEDK